MTKNIIQQLSKKQLAELVNLNLFLLEELEDEASLVNQYVSKVIVQVTLTNSSIQERQDFKKLLMTDEQKALQWIVSRSTKWQAQIVKQLEQTFTKIKLKAVNEQA
ncbi:MAG: hypothetical protein GF390_03925 [Candidatus Pacebacteria bacterium]|nr:hypothetical protein [Candidatus Paceibacterota bacterium]